MTNNDDDPMGLVGVFFAGLVYAAIFGGILASFTNSGVFLFVIVLWIIIFIIYLIHNRAKRSQEGKIAREWLNLLTKENIFLGTDAWNKVSGCHLEKLASCCKRNSTSILLPGIQFNEMESAKDINNEEVLRKVSDLHLKNLIIIEGMNYTPSFSAPCDTIEALVKFAEKAISEKTPFTFITDDPSLIVRLKCFQDDKFVHIESADEVDSRLKDA